MAEPGCSTVYALGYGMQVFDPSRHFGQTGREIVQLRSPSERKQAASTSTIWEPQVSQKLTCLGRTLRASNKCSTSLTIEGLDRNCWLNALHEY
jgi:hypothetical protein